MKLTSLEYRRKGCGALLTVQDASLLREAEQLLALAASDANREDVDTSPVFLIELDYNDEDDPALHVLFRLMLQLTLHQVASTAFCLAKLMDRAVTPRPTPDAPAEVIRAFPDHFFSFEFSLSPNEKIVRGTSPILMIWLYAAAYDLEINHSSEGEFSFSFCDIEGAVQLKRRCSRAVLRRFDSQLDDYIASNFLIEPPPGPKELPISRDRFLLGPVKFVVQRPGFAGGLLGFDSEQWQTLRRLATNDVTLEQVVAVTATSAATYEGLSGNVIETFFVNAHTLSVEAPHLKSDLDGSLRESGNGRNFPFTGRYRNSRANVWQDASERDLVRLRQLIDLVRFNRRDECGETFEVQFTGSKDGQSIVHTLPLKIVQKLAPDLVKLTL